MIRTPRLPEPDQPVEDYDSDGNLIQRTDPRDIDTIKAWATERTNHWGFRLLRETDWMVVRKAEAGNPIPQEIRDERGAIRAEITAITDGIAAATTLAEFDAVNWPSRRHELMMLYRPELGG